MVWSEKAKAEAFRVWNHTLGTWAEKLNAALDAAAAVDGDAWNAAIEAAANAAEGVFSGTSKLGTPQKNELYGGGELWYSGSMYDEGRIDAADAIRSLKRG